MHRHVHVVSYYVLIVYLHNSVMKIKLEPSAMITMIIVLVVILEWEVLVESSIIQLTKTLLLQSKKRKNQLVV